MRASRTLLVGAALLSLLIVLGFAAPLVASEDPLRQIPGANLLPPGPGHPLGTDDLNRDVLSRVLYGIRTSLIVVLSAVPIAAVTGVVLGLASTVNRAADTILARVSDVVLAFPALILAILLTALRGPGTVTVVLAIAVAEAPVFLRLTRAEVLRLRGTAYAEAARIAGASRGTVLTKHVLPNALEPLAVQVALALSLGVFVESGLSFVGVGVRPPTPSLGSVLAGAVNNWDANAAYAWGPLLAIVALSLALLLVARGFAGARR
ncbi:ABC transporter permease [Tsukamurella paurometabola]|uniref:Probable D,D-dipeptide transport system permease protein ddpC n=1 Tax=Tsukamurella paurometabola TaxID=2061 RepID=A0A3P8LEV6_TSUPA|nr:ABC transporter permease [Tsukamurella paurometabola]UEA82152.1 ABC transporter permease [Tsukamurella paurometabola]VDR39192.1 Probable D,D-dipeptide transport system permease protein ddpC [Tsukamurella paurometabola]